MKLSTPIAYTGNAVETVEQISAMERVGLDTVWLAEVYTFDAPTIMGYIAAKTATVEIGSGILPIYSRTPTLTAMTAAGLVGSSRVDLQACKLEYSIVSPK